MIGRVIFTNVRVEDLGLAVYAARWLAEHPDHKDTVIRYDKDGERVFYAKRNKSSITVRHLTAREAVR